MVAGSGLPPSVSGAIGLPQVPPTRAFLAVMTQLWDRVFGSPTTAVVSDAGASYDAVQMQALVDAVKELQARHDGD